jgi:hypothetical protein
MAAIVLLLLLVPRMLAPETHDDAWTYALAGPDRWLKAHGLAVLFADYRVHFPMLAELPYAFALAAGADQGASWLSLALFLCGAGAAAATVAPRGARGWAFLLVVGAANATSAAFGKSDGPAAGFVLLAFALAVKGRLAPAAAVAGMALATKYSAPVAVAWVAVVARMEGRRFRTAHLAVAGLVVVPWLVKSWLLTGDPAYPLLGARFPSVVPGWDARVAEAWRAWGHGEPAWKWAESAVRGLAGENAAFLFMVPMLLTRRGGTGPVIAALIAYGSWFVMMSSTHAARHAFPALAGMLVLASAEAPGLARAPLPARAGWFAALAVAAACRLTAPFGAAVWNANPFPYILGMQDRAVFVRQGLTVVADLEGRLAGAGSRGAVMLVGEQRTYGMPRTALEMTPDGGAGVPWFWSEMGRARDDRDILKRFRQLGADRLAYNPVRGFATGSIFHPFAWPPAGLARWAGFFGRWMDPEYVSPTMDYRHGMFYLYRLRATPRPAPAFLMHLPGTEGEFYRRAGMTGKRSLNESVRLQLSALASMPPVGFYYGVAGYGARLAGQYPLALSLYERPWRAGQVEQALLMVRGVCLLKTGRYAEALESFERGRGVYPDLSLDVDDYSARARFLLALSVARVDPGRAARVAGEGLDVLGRSPWRKRFRTQEGFLRLARAMAELGMGRREAGFADLKAAEPLMPGVEKLNLEGLDAYLSANARMVEDRTR